MIEALLAAYDLKALPRTGWLRKGIADGESVAAHSWGMGLLVLMLCPEDVDRERALTYALLHDLPEVRTGDITPHDGVSKRDKAVAEAGAMAALCANLPAGDRLEQLWHDYEAQADAAARFVKQVDRLDMALQALSYRRRTGTDLGEFLDSADPVVDHPVLRPVFDAIREAMSASDPR